MSSLFKRDNGVYYLAFFDPSRSPSRKTVSTRVRSKRDALVVQAKLDAGLAVGEFDPFTMSPRDFLRGVPDPPAGPDLSTFGVAVAAFIASRSNLRPTTVDRYRSVLDRLVEHVGPLTPTRAVDHRDVQSFVDSTDTVAITRVNYTRAISTCFRWLEAEGVREGDPTRSVRLPRVPRKHPRYLSPEDVDAICRAIESDGASPHKGAESGLWLLPIVRANVYLGLRAGEVVNLRWDDVDLDRHVAVVRQSAGFATKSGHDRSVPLATAVLDVLGGTDQRSEFVFPNHSGHQLHRKYLSRAFKRYARAAGLPEWVHFHVTRHTAASWLAERGVSVEAIRLFLGHAAATTATTLRYMHLAPDAYASQITGAFDVQSIRRAER